MPSSRRRCAATSVEVIPVVPTSTPAAATVRRSLSLVALLLLVSACATRPPPAIGTAPESAWLAHRASVETLTDWQIRGRVAIRRDDDGWHADFDWQQRGDRYRLRLRGPFGQGAIELQGGPLGVWLKRQDQAPVYAGSAERLLREETGWDLPVVGLGDWLRGLPVAQEPAAFDWDGQGRLQSLRQDGWSIDYRRYRGVGERQLPDRMQLLRDSLLVKVVIDEWDIP
jgi:outer membrane lipoprotein LolB